MPRFDPVSIRESELEFGLRFEAQVTKSELPGSQAYSSLGSVIACWLVGLISESGPVLLRSIEWLREGIASIEPFGESTNYGLMRHHHALAIALWMRDGVKASEMWSQARAFEEAAWLEGRPATTAEIAKHGLDDYMAYCVQAELYDRGIDAYERYEGRKELVLRRIRSPRQFGYAVCQHHCREGGDPESIQRAGRRMLATYLDTHWLSMGQYIRAATWLKIVYWREGGPLVPLDCILKAYEDMRVPRPEFIARSADPSV